MNPFIYYVGRSLQLLGMATITLVVLLFFVPRWSMEPLLYFTLAGVAEFYVGTWLLNRESK